MTLDFTKPAQARIIGVLSWFDESPTWLAATVASMARICDHIVAVDGRYALYEDKRVRSGSEQHDVILETCRGAGVGLTLHTRNREWSSEVEKRNFCFKVAQLEAVTFRDWFFILDADEVLTEFPDWLHHQLDAYAADGFNVATADFYEVADPHANPERHAISVTSPVDYEYSNTSPRFWRVLEDMRVDGQHYHYTGVDENGDRQILWGQQEPLTGHLIWNLVDERWQRLTKWADLTMHVRIENRCLQRAVTRRHKREAYYSIRDRLGIEQASPPEATKLLKQTIQDRQEVANAT